MKKTTERTYIDRMHTYGRVWTLAVLFVLLAVPVCFSLYLNAKYGADWPAASDLGKAMLKVAPLFYVTAIVEVTAYSPILGTGAMYLSFTTGNISNLKLPCALAAMDAAGVKSNSEEGEVISTIAIASSSIVTTVIIALCVMVFKPILPYITAEDSVIAPAFRQVLPSLFGALGASYFAKHWRISVAPVILLCVLLIFSGTIPAGTLVPVGVVISIIGCLVMWKLKLL